MLQELLGLSEPTYSLAAKLSSILAADFLALLVRHILSNFRLSFLELYKLFEPF